MIRATWQRDASFRRVLTERVNAYFDERGLSKNDNLALHAKAIFFIVTACTSYYFLVFVVGSWLCVAVSAATLTFALLGIGFNIQHDANHGAFSKYRRLNRLYGMFLDVLGTSSIGWHTTHNVMHHTYTNVPEHDGDMEFSRFVRLSPRAQWLRCHSWQHIYVWGFYALAHISFLFVDYIRFFRGRVGNKELRLPRGGELVLLVVGKMGFYTLAFGVPIYARVDFSGTPFALWSDIAVILGIYFAISVGIGLGYQLVAESAHIVEPTSHPTASSGQMDTEWAIHQISTTANFATANRFWTFFLGGLNFQREHHLFPKIAHVHYPALAPIVKAACEEHGVRYHEFPTFRSAIASHYRFVKTMGRRPTFENVA